jgi:hypothetical protein
MVCSTRRNLYSDVDSIAHHLGTHLGQHETENDPRVELGEVRRIAQELIDAIDHVRKHEDQHKCSG